MSHEKSITIRVDGRFVNIPTVVQGRPVSPSEAFELFRKGVIKPLGGKTFDTQEEAVAAAKKRSASFDQ